jgi:polar amino acid transport system substrate-binding protein
MDWSAEIESVKAGKVDIMLGAMGWTKERSEVINLTDPIYYFGIFLVQKKETNYSTVEDMAGRTVGTVNGFAQAQELKTVPGTKEVKLYDTTDAALRDVVAGRVDMIILDPPVTGYAIKQHPEWGLHQVLMTADPQKYPMMAGYFSIVMGINKEETELHDAVNAEIQRMWSECTNVENLGKFGLAEARWFQPPKENARAGTDRRPTGHPDCSEKCTASLQQ